MAVRLKRPMYAGHTVGLDVRIAKFACMRYESGLIPATKWSELTEHFGPAMKEALVEVIQPREGIKNTGNIGQATWDVLWEHLDAYRRQRYRLWKIPVVPRPDPVPDLGPLFIGGRSLLDEALTHATHGIAGYPAVDEGWIAWRTVIAPENITVTKDSSANVGDAFYATGDSKLRYWFGHLVIAPKVGARIRKGQTIGHIAPQRIPHVHVGVNASLLIGHQLLYGRTGHGPDYTTGSPTLRVQLKEALSLR